MNKSLLTLTFIFSLFLVSSWGQDVKKNRYLMALDDAQLDIGVRFSTIFAFDDRAPLSANPHYEAMMNLIRFGATLESMLAGVEEPLNDIDMSREFGQNGYNRTLLEFFIRYGFGESSDLKMQKNWLELSFGPGHFKAGKGGMNIHLDYQYNIFNTGYGSGIKSVSRLIDYEIFAGGRVGFDWSFSRSESEAGFFTHLNEEIERIADAHDLSASQLIRLQEMVESSKILLPEDVGGRAFHFGPIAGGRLSTKVFRNGRLFFEAMGFYDLMDLASKGKNKENRRSQHQASLNLGFNLTIGARGEVVVNSFF